LGRGQCGHDSKRSPPTLCLGHVDCDGGLYPHEEAIWASAYGKRVTPKILLLAGIGSLAIGFYDGLFGPGTGSFFIFYFIRYLRVDFLHAAALAKIGNVMTNLAALSFFIPSGHVLFALGGMMAVANMIGSICGVKMALKYGSGFIRILFGGFGGKCNSIKTSHNFIGVCQPSVFLGRWLSANSICSICSFDTSSNDDDFGRILPD
jgi:hypothetical protein